MGSIYTYVFVQVQNVCQSSWNNLRKFIFSFDHMTFGFQCPSVYRQNSCLSRFPPIKNISLCYEWWHSFMNQRLNLLVLLYKKCNCIIMSLNTYNKNVDIILHYCIITQIKLHGFWKRSALTNMKKDALKYMIMIIMNEMKYLGFHL